LCEIVTEPDISSPKEAREVIKNISTILQCLGVHDPKLDLMKADVNISISESGYTRVEIKNISGFREIERALIYEIARQKNCHDEKIKIVQETRLWNPKKGTTESLRTKESDEDYGYIYDSDLVPVNVDWKTKLPEMPADKIRRYTSVFKIAHDDAKIIASDFGLAQLFDEMDVSVNPVLAARWIRRELIRVLNYNDIDTSEMDLDKRQLTVLLRMLQEKKITDKVGQQLIEKLIVKPFDVKDYVAKQGLQSLSDTDELSDLCKKVVVENPGAAKDYREGKEQALNFLLGSVMKSTKGKADPQVIRELLKKILG
jgi:aspartyl-tRNA(Asn)/glutamyl-tRNA(Gln) amidotransferase subunit B